MPWWSEHSLSGPVAALVFLAFTGVGYAAQVHKLVTRHRSAAQGSLESSRVCDGLLPFREFMSFLAFLLFGLSGATRSYFDIVLVGTRFPVILLSAVVIGFLAFYKLPRTRLFFTCALIGCGFFVFTISLPLVGIHIGGGLLALCIDKCLVAISLLLLLGKLSQARTMLVTRRSAAVSWFRELGLILKDGSGLWYSITIGEELFWVAVTHVLSAMSSAAICLTKFLIEHGPLRTRANGNL